MQLTNENTLSLYHFCVHIADALRPILNTHNYNDADPSYWIPKLTQFEQIIKEILETSDSDSLEIKKLNNAMDEVVKSFGSESE